MHVCYLSTDIMTLNVSFPWSNRGPIKALLNLILEVFVIFVVNEGSSRNQQSLQCYPRNLWHFINSILETFFFYFGLLIISDDRIKLVFLVFSKFHFVFLYVYLVIQEMFVSWRLTRMAIMSESSTLPASKWVHLQL